jgi:nucleotide-binding universal stress UspA family protein
MEASHAIRAALPLLARAAAVHIVTVTEDSQQLPATGAAEYLSRHGVASELSDLPRGNRRISDTLVEGAKALGGAYLVAGAYGHTRFREAILGGVTRELIEAASIPLLITH